MKDTTDRSATHAAMTVTSETQTDSGSVNPQQQQKVAEDGWTCITPYPARGVRKYWWQA